VQLVLLRRGGSLRGLSFSVPPLHQDHKADVFREGGSGLCVAGVLERGGRRLCGGVLARCHYVTEGNYDALAMVTLGKRLLGRIGVNPERLRIEWVSASEGIRFAEIMNDFANRLKKLGPLGKGEGLELSELKSMLEGLMKTVPYIKLAERERLARHLRGGEGYEGLFTAEEVDRLFREMPCYYIDPERCQACMICLRRCPADAIDGGKDKIHVIEQDRCIRCGTCMDACPPRFGAVRKVIGAAAPPPPPEEARALRRKGKAR